MDDIDAPGCVEAGDVLGGSGVPSGLGPAGPDASAGCAQDPPLLTGGLSAQFLPGIYLSPHKFKFTVFQGLDVVQDFCERFVKENAGLPFAWEEIGPASRWEHILRVRGLGGVDAVKIYSPRAGASSVVYTLVEVTGTGCEHLGPAGFSAVVVALRASGWRWRAKQCDFAFDQHGVSHFTPRSFYRACKSGRFVSRVYNAEDCQLVLGEGQTAYFGRVPGAQTVKGNYQVCVYNRRGFVRCEPRIFGADAESCMAGLPAEPGLWPAHVKGYLLRAVDFRDVEPGERNPQRCPRSGWFSRFMGDSVRVRKLDVEAPVSVECLPIGRADDFVRRNWRALFQVDEAFGSEWLRRRVRYWAKGRESEEAAQVDELKSYRGCGLCGLNDEEIPF